MEMLLGSGNVAVARAGAQADREPGEIAAPRCELDRPGHERIGAVVRLLAELFEYGRRSQRIGRSLGDEAVDRRGVLGHAVRIGCLSRQRQQRSNECFHVARGMSASLPANHNARLWTYRLVSRSARGHPTSAFPGRSVTKLGAPESMSQL